MKKLVLILFILVLLGVQTTSGYTYEDHFLIENQPDYGPDPIQAQWQTGAPGYLMLYNATKSVYYSVSQFGSGTYEWNGVTWVDNYPQPWLLYGGQDLAGGDPQFTGTHYALLLYPLGGPGSEGVFLQKVVAGTPTIIDSNTAITVNGVHSYKVEWDQTAGSHKVYQDNVLIIDTTDNSIPDDGYMGMGYNVWNWYKVDEFDFTASAPPTTTPPTTTPITPTPAPILTCTNRNTNITIEKGETWIKWNWSYSENISQLVIDYQNIYLNGTLFTSGYPHNYLNLPYIGSNSYQVLEVWGMNTTYCNCTQYIYSSVRSDPASVWWPLLVGIGLLCIGYFVPLFGFLAIIILLFGFFMVVPEYTQSWIVITYGLSAVVAMIVTAFRLMRK
jgi:hypothetical protein